MRYGTRYSTKSICKMRGHAWARPHRDVPEGRPCLDRLSQYLLDFPRCDTDMSADRRAPAASVRRTHTAHKISYDSRFRQRLDQRKTASSIRPSVGSGRSRVGSLRRRIHDLQRASIRYRRTSGSAGSTHSASPAPTNACLVETAEPFRTLLSHNSS